MLKASTKEELKERSSLNGQRDSFLGSFEHSIDAKGRVALPSAFRGLLREEDGNSVVLTNFITDGVRCLDGFSLSAWQQFESSLKQKGRFDPQVRKLETFYLARASLCACDSHGRINIPSHLREYASLDKDVVFTSALHGFRIWQRSVWKLVFSQAEELLLDDPSLFAGVDS